MQERLFSIFIYFGWLYARTNTLIAPWVAHGMVGILAFNILGV